MGRRGVTALHLVLILSGAVLYLLFVLPRWWVLTGDIPSGLSTSGRLAAGVPIALAALPVLSILRRALSRKTPVPELALRLRAWSAVLHVVAGTLIMLAAIAEIWLRLSVGGPYLFAVYGAAAAIAILAVLALYLSFVAEKPPAPPKPPKPAKPAKLKAEKKPSGKQRDAKSVVPGEAVDADSADVVADEHTSVTTQTDAAAADDEEPADPAAEKAPDSESVISEATPEPAEAPQPAGLLNKQPAGIRRNRRGR